VVVVHMRLDAAAQHAAQHARCLAHLRLDAAVVDECPGVGSKAAVRASDMLINLGNLVNAPRLLRAACTRL
jgi:hypothetical protein